MWTIFKVFIEFVTILLPFYFLVFFSFGHEICGILVPQPRIKPVPHALEGKVLIPGPPEKSLELCSLNFSCLQPEMKVHIPGHPNVRNTKAQA